MSKGKNSLNKKSLKRMLDIASGSRQDVVDKINPLIEPFAEISDNDHWMPRGQTTLAKQN